jgi:hypothetical protein
MRKLLTILVILLTLWITIPAHAQNSKHLSSVKVEISPEYDQPKVLVIYRISLPTGTTLPTNLDLRIPSQAEVWAVATVNPTDSRLQTAPYDRSVNGSLATLTITATSLNIQVEYYEALVKDGITRHITYDWTGDYSVDAFSVMFQQPVGATDLTTNPILVNSGVDQSGSVIYQSTPQALETGQTYTLTADYQKVTDSLSTTGLAVQPAQPLNSSTSGRVTMISILPWILAGIGAALIAVAIVYGINLGKGGTRRTAGPRKRHIQPRQASSTGEVYCVQCGKRAQTGDVFCRTCGTRLPKED